MVTITSKRQKDGGFDTDITLDNASVHEILAALDMALDTLNKYDVSTLAIIDYVLNRDRYVEKKGGDK